MTIVVTGWIKCRRNYKKSDPIVRENPTVKGDTVINPHVDEKPWDFSADTEEQLKQFDDALKPDEAETKIEAPDSERLATAKQELEPMKDVVKDNQDVAGTFVEQAIAETPPIALNIPEVDSTPNSDILSKIQGDADIPEDVKPLLTTAVPTVIRSPIDVKDVNTNAIHAVKSGDRVVLVGGPQNLELGVGIIEQDDGAFTIYSVHDILLSHMPVDAEEVSQPLLQKTEDIDITPGALQAIISGDLKYYGSKSDDAKSYHKAMHNIHMRYLAFGVDLAIPFAFLPPELQTLEAEDIQYRYDKLTGKVEEEEHEGLQHRLDKEEEYEDVTKEFAGAAKQYSMQQILKGKRDEAMPIIERLLNNDTSVGFDNRLQRVLFNAHKKVSSTPEFAKMTKDEQKEAIFDDFIHTSSVPGSVANALYDEYVKDFLAHGRRPRYDEAVEAIVNRFPSLTHPRLEKIRSLMYKEFQNIEATMKEEDMAPSELTVRMLQNVVTKHGLDEGFANIMDDMVRDNKEVLDYLFDLLDQKEEFLPDEPKLDRRKLDRHNITELLANAPMPVKQAIWLSTLVEDIDQQQAIIRGVANELAGTGFHRVKNDEEEKRRETQRAKLSKQDKSSSKKDVTPPSLSEEEAREILNQEPSNIEAQEAIDYYEKQTTDVRLSEQELYIKEEMKKRGLQPPPDYVLDRMDANVFVPGSASDTSKGGKVKRDAQLTNMAKLLDSVKDNGKYKKFTKEQIDALRVSPKELIRTFEESYPSIRMVKQGKTYVMVDNEGVPIVGYVHHGSKDKVDTKMSLYAYDPDTGKYMRSEINGVKHAVRKALLSDDPMSFLEKAEDLETYDKICQAIAPYHQRVLSQSGKLAMPITGKINVPEAVPHRTIADVVFAAASGVYRGESFGNAYKGTSFGRTYKKMRRPKKKAWKTHDGVNTIEPVYDDETDEYTISPRQQPVARRQYDIKDKLRNMGFSSMRQPIPAETMLVNGGKSLGMRYDEIIQMAKIKQDEKFEALKHLQRQFPGTTMSSRGEIIIPAKYKLDRAIVQEETDKFMQHIHKIAEKRLEGMKDKAVHDELGR